MESSTDVTKQRKPDPWFGVGVGMVLVSVIGLVYTHLYR